MLTTPLVGRLVAVLLLLTGLAAAWLHVVEPTIAAYAEVDDRLLETRQLIEHFERLAVRAPVYDDRLEALERHQRTQGYYLAGDTDALAAASLQERLRRAIEDNGGSLRSLQPLSGTDEAGFRRITVRALMTGTTEALVRTLQDIEAGAPVLFVDNLQIRGVPGGGSDAGWNGEPALGVGFEVYGYLPQEAP